MDSKAAERTARGVNRVLAKLEGSIENGNYYEAHQMYRTLYFRYTSHEKYDECLELLFSGAMKLAEKFQEASSADLGILMIDVLEKRTSNSDYTMWIQNLCEIIALLTNFCVERETLINRTIQWSAEVSNNRFGHPIARKKIAEVFWSENNYEQARQHFLLAKDGKLFGRILVAISQSKGFKSEIDIIIAQAAFQLLCIEDPINAEQAFVTYTTNHPQIRRKTIPFKQPLLNFVHFLFRTIEMRRSKGFRTLCGLYEKVLKKDEAYQKYISKIGQIYFGLEPPPSETGGSNFMNGVFGDLFARLFSGFDDDDDITMRDSTVTGTTNELD